MLMTLTSERNLLVRRGNKIEVGRRSPAVFVICHRDGAGEINDEDAVVKAMYEFAQEKKDLYRQYVSGSKKVDDLSFDDVPWARLLPEGTDGDCGDFPLKDDKAPAMWLGNNSTKAICDDL
jgi:hypothetical protein